MIGGHMKRSALRKAQPYAIGLFGLLMSTGAGLIWYVKGQKYPVEKEFVPIDDNIIAATEQIANEYLDKYSLNDLEGFQYRSIYSTIIRNADFDTGSLVIATLKSQSISDEEKKYVVSTKLMAKLRQCLSPLVETAKNGNLFAVSAFALLAAKNHGTILPEKIDSQGSEEKIAKFESIAKANGCLPYIIGLRGYARYVTSIEEMDHLNEASYRAGSQLGVISRELAKFKDTMERIEHKFLVARVRDAEATIENIENFKSEIENWEKCFVVENSAERSDRPSSCSNEDHSLRINRLYSFADNISTKIKSHSPGYASAYSIIFGYFLSSGLGIAFTMLAVGVKNRRRSDDGKVNRVLQENLLDPPNIIGE